MLILEGLSALHGMQTCVPSLRDCSRGQLSELVRLDELDDHLAFIAEEAVELAETLWEDMLENVELPDKDRDKYLEEMAERIDDIVCRELIFC